MVRAWMRHGRVPCEETVTVCSLIGFPWLSPPDNSTDIETPAGIGNVACAAVSGFCFRT